MAATSCKKYSKGSCGDVFDSSKFRKRFHFSYFFSMNISQPKVRVKFPRVVLKTMQRRSSSEHESFKEGGKVKKRVSPKGLLPMKVGRACSNFFRCKKGSIKEGSCSSSIDNDRVRGKNAFDLADKKEAERLRKVKMEEMGLLKLSFKSLMKKRNGDCSGTDAIDGGSNDDQKQEGSHSLPRVPLRIMTAQHRLKVARSMRKKMVKMGSGKTDQEDGERSVQELCKKRILLGEKCRPLNHSGTLQYDKDGVLLPETIPE